MTVLLDIDLPTQAGPDEAEIVARYQARQAARGPILQGMREVIDTYNGDLVIPLAGFDRDEKSAVANLLNTGIEQLSMRVASTMPSIFCPEQEVEGVQGRGQKGADEWDARVRAERDLARRRKQALYGGWEASDLPILQRRRARWMLGLASAPVVLRPDRGRGVAVWDLRHPLSTFPADTTNPDDMCPDDCIFTVTRTHGWLMRNYPEQYYRLRRRASDGPDAKCTLIEYRDAEVVVLIVLGDADVTPAVVAGPRGRLSSFTGPMRGLAGTDLHVELERSVNRAEMCTAVVPGRVTLDRMMGQFDQMIGMYQLQSKITALEVIAIEKGIFPDLYLVSRPNEQAKYITGPHDGRTGKVNIIAGGDVKEINSSAGFQGFQLADRLERGTRLAGGIPPELGGESSSNIRTGRRGDSVLSAAVEYPVQEQQTVMARSLQEENKRFIAVQKGYFGSRSSSFYVNWKGAKGRVTYTPNELFTTDENIVTFSHAGTDLNGLTIMVGQLTAMGVMSTQTAAEILPLVDDPEQEHDRIVKEQLEKALLAGIQTKMNSGELAPGDGAWLIIQVQNDRMELAQAMVALDEMVRARQSASGPPGSAEGPVDPNSPEAQAGLAAGTAAEQQAMAATVPAPPQGMRNVASILGDLRRGQMTIPSERPQVA